MSGLPRLLGALLAGGRGTRFGGPKAEALVDGEAMGRRVAGALSEVAEEVVVVSSRAVPALEELVRIPDRVPGRGPLGGLHAALHRARARGLEGVLLVACDLPLLTPELLAVVARASVGAPAAAPVRNGRLEAACAAYRLEVLPEVERRVSGEDGSLHALFALVGGREVDIGGGADGALLNVNTHEDRLRAEATLRAAGRT